MADDDSRFAGVKRPGVDEHVWHHVPDHRPRPGSTERSPAMNATTKCSFPGLCAQQLRSASAYRAKNTVEGRRVAEKVLASLPTGPILEVKRLGKTLKRWRDAFLAYIVTGRASNGGTEAISGLIELHGSVARGFRNREHYRLRMLLIGGLSHPDLVWACERLAVPG